jgi:hypothetical protein
MVLAPLAGSKAVGAEPTYTVTLPGNQIVSLRIESKPAANGRRNLRVWNQPKSAAKSDLQIDTVMVLEADGKPSSSRTFLGINPDQGMSLEAVRTGTGFTVREPALAGDLQFGAPLFTPLIAELFIGRMYDFKRGGPQTFAHLLDTFVSTAKINTLTLTAEGKPEIIELPNGPVKAQKLRYLLNETLLPEPMRTGVFYVGPNGEVLKCDTPFFGVPLRATGPAVLENAGRRLTLRFKNPDSPDRVAVLQADRQSDGDWKIKLDAGGRSESLATLLCDSRYRLKRMETPWHGRPFVASVVSGDTVHWTLAGGPDQQTPVPGESPVWFLPHWFFTELWEGIGGAFANLAAAEDRDGYMLPLFFGQREANLFTLERMPDAVTKSAVGNSFSLRHYRFHNGGKQPVPQAVPPGGQPKPPAANYDLYTDGSRLAVLLSSDGIKVVRNGWEAIAAALKPPLPSGQAVPGAAPRAESAF